MINSNSKIHQDILELVDKEILNLLPKDESRLAEAMRYSALAQGKRLRPILLINSADVFNVDIKYSLRVAAAIEITHCYSLIHDDLPAMDDDDFRRGMPSCHKKFDEATAILAGDALLTLAFEILSHEDAHPDPQIRCELIKILTSCIGSFGMAGGQMLDLIYERENVDNFDQVVEMQFMKTAKLFMACSEMGAVLGNANIDIRKAFSEFGKNFGLAFQFIDDLEDLYQKKILNSNNVVKHLGEDKTLLEIKNYIDKAQLSLKELSNCSSNLNFLVSGLLNSFPE